MKAEYPIIINDLSIWKADDYGGTNPYEENWVVIEVNYDFGISYWRIPGWFTMENGSELFLDRIFEVEPFERIVYDWREKPAKETNPGRAAAE